jgi:hypothetical protein
LIKNLSHQGLHSINWEFTNESENVMNKDKKSYDKPQLVVLGREMPDEKVLAACKTNNYGPGPGSTEKHCRKWPATCKSNAAS